MGSADRGGVGIDPGLPDKADGIFKSREGGVLRRDLHSVFDADNSAEFALDIHTFAVGIFHDLPAAGDIVFQGESGAVIHNRIPAGVDACFCQFNVLAVVQVDEHVHGRLVRDQTKHGTEFFRPEFLYCHNRCL